VKDNTLRSLWDGSRRKDRSREIRVFEPKGEVQLTLSHWQQSELEFHDSKPYHGLLNAE
jgi:hypothetical protein